MYYCAYTRVSTQRQGEGVSLEAQHDAITRYAARHRLRIGAWFDEVETAAQAGRPVFDQLVRSAMREGRGLIIHKIDRGARNLRDWAKLGTAIDLGVDVRFAHDDLDLRTRSGRLSADIQAVVSADYVRNLREETLKGFYGRLKQGLYPLPAPLGYLNNGSGKVKTVDPNVGPFIRSAFQECLRGDHTLTELAEKMSDRGLRNRAGGVVSPESLSQILRNPFYAGEIRLKNGECFPGRHEPLVSRTLFDEVQRFLRQRRRRAYARHAFAFSRMIACLCGYRLIGERQKGRVYYRCHTESCAMPGIREDRIDTAVIAKLQTLPENELPLLAYSQTHWGENIHFRLGIPEVPSIVTSATLKRKAACLR